MERPAPSEVEAAGAPALAAGHPVAMPNQEFDQQHAEGDRNHGVHRRHVRSPEPPVQRRRQQDGRQDAEHEQHPFEGLPRVRARRAVDVEQPRRAHVRRKRRSHSQTDEEEHHRDERQRQERRLQPGRRRQRLPAGKSPRHGHAQGDREHEAMALDAGERRGQEIRGRTRLGVPAGGRHERPARRPREHAAAGPLTGLHDGRPSGACRRAGTQSRSPPQATRARVRPSWRGR